MVSSDIENKKENQMQTLTKSETKSNVVEIPPNAAKLIESLRHVGYDNYSALMDLIDNSLDAGATVCNVWWKQDKGQPTIVIGDNGSGMDEMRLNQAMRLGSLVDKNPETDLGRFGMGLTTATLSLCRGVVILTKTESGELLKGTTDIDEMIAENRFKMVIGGITSDDKELFVQMTKGGNTGTVVQLLKVDRLTNSNLSVASDILRKRVSRVFRIFLENNRSIIVNGKKAEPFDPLNPIHDEPSRIILDETFPYVFGGDDDEDNQEMVRVKVAFLPEVSTEVARDLSINEAGQGFYILRNLREIVDGSSLNIYIKNPALNRFRAEIHVSGKLDEAIQINFAKSRVNLKQSLADKISALVNPHVMYIRKNYLKKSTKSKIDQVQHTESEQEIAKKAKILELPPKPKPTENPPQENKGAPKQKVEQKNRPTTPDKETTRLRRICKFEEVDFGSQGQLYEAYPDGATIVIQLNTAHPFYSRIIEPYAQDPNLRNAIDFLLFSLASAEMKHSTDQEQTELMTAYKTTVSGNLRSLCS